MSARADTETIHKVLRDAPEFGLRAGEWVEIDHTRGTVWAFRPVGRPDFGALAKAIGSPSATEATGAAQRPALTVETTPSPKPSRRKSRPRLQLVRGGAA